MEKKDESKVQTLFSKKNLINKFTEDDLYKPIIIDNSNIKVVSNKFEQIEFIAPEGFKFKNLGGFELVKDDS